jgi:hypothetical protein
MVKSSLIAALLVASVAVPVWADTTDSQPNAWRVVPSEQTAQAQAQQTPDTTKRKIKVLRYWSFGVLH